MKIYKNIKSFSLKAMAITAILIASPFLVVYADTIPSTPSTTSGDDVTGGATIVTPVTLPATTGGDDITGGATLVTPTAPVVVAPVSTVSSGGGSYSSGGGSEYVPLAIPLATTTLATTTLGSALSCPLLTNYVIPGRFNNPSDISKIQVFFNVNDNANLTVNGILDTATVNAVKAFQGKYLSQIMGPWGSVTPSGQVYITTLKKIISITCGTPITLSAQDVTIINAYKASLAQGISATTANNVSATASNTTISATTSTTTGNDNSALVGNAISATNNSFFSKIFSTIASWFKR